MLYSIAIQGLDNPQTDIDNPDPTNFPQKINKTTSFVYVSGIFKESDFAADNQAFISFSNEHEFPLEIQFRDGVVSAVKCDGSKISIQNEGFRCADDNNSKQLLKSKTKQIRYSNGDEYDVLICFKPFEATVIVNDRVLLNQDLHVNRPNDRISDAWVGGLHNVNKFQIRDYEGENPRCTVIG